MNSQEKEISYRVLVDRVDDLEEKIDRLVLSNELAYDKRFHLEIITESNKLVSDILGSKLELESKNILVELISTLFKNLNSSDQTIDKLN